jgi:signal transduction protein with GAF and PtsI domain
MRIKVNQPAVRELRSRAQIKSSSRTSASSLLLPLVDGWREMLSQGAPVSEARPDVIKS